jgi:hypothetical protein
MREAGADVRGSSSSAGSPAKLAAEALFEV